jgi:hypothetical protein
VLAGALDDETKADALAARVGGEVHEVALAPQPYRGIAQLVARRDVPDLYGYSGLGQMMTVVNGIAYVVTQSGIESFSLTEPELPSIRKVTYDNKPVRIVEHAGAPHLLDVEGHWWRVGEKLERVPSFDPNDNAGKVVKFGSITFAVDEESVTISGAEHEEQAWPLGTKDRAVFKVSGERLALLRDRTVFVLTIGKPKPRLTKLCISVDTERKITGPASYSFGPMHLVSDRSGKLDVWTDEWGFIDPSLTSSSTLDCSDDEYETGNIDVTPLFGQISVSVAASINCEYECGD